MGDFHDLAQRQQNPEPTAPAQFERCAKCSSTYRYPRPKEPKGTGNRIIGRSITGGYLCRDCYEAGERFDYRDAAMESFAERHRDDDWGAAIRASRRVVTREDQAELLAFLRQQVARIGKR